MHERPPYTSSAPPSNPHCVKHRRRTRISARRQMEVPRWRRRLCWQACAAARWKVSGGRACGVGDVHSVWTYCGFSQHIFPDGDVCQTRGSPSTPLSQHGSFFIFFFFLPSFFLHASTFGSTLASPDHLHLHEFRSDSRLLTRVRRGLRRSAESELNDEPLLLLSGLVSPPDPSTRRWSHAGKRRERQARLFPLAGIIKGPVV